MPQSPRSILYIIPSTHCGGAELSTLRLIQKLDRQLFTPLVMVPNKGPLSQALMGYGIRVFISRWPHHFFDQSAIEWFILKRRISFFLKDTSIDLIHNNSMLSLSCALAIQNHLKCPMITHWHDNRCPRPLITLLKKNITMPLVCVAKTVQDTLQQQVVSPLNTSVVYNGVDHAVFFPQCTQAARKSLKIPEKPFYIGLCSRLTPGKGVDLIIDVLAKLPESIHLILSGYWDDPHFKKTIQSRIDKHHCQHRIKDCGFIDKVETVINAVDIIVIPSQTEAFPLISLEAMACKTPVLCHKLGGLSEQIDHGKNGFFVQKNDLSDWVEKITRLYKNKALYTSLSENAYKKSMTFSLSSMCQQFEYIYKKTIQNENSDYKTILDNSREGLS